MKKTLSLIFFLIVLFIINAFFGNPISKILANNSANKYIKENYDNLNLKRDKVFYNFKDGCYIINLENKNSIDTKFSLSFNSFGNLKYDNFEYRLFNTYRRFEYEIYEYGRRLEEKHRFKYKISLSILENEDHRDILKLDDKVDFNNFPLKVSADVYGFSNKLDFEKTMIVLKRLQKILDKENLEAFEYSIILVPLKDRAKDGKAESWQNAFSIYNIPDDLIRNENISGLKDLYNAQKTSCEKIKDR